MTVENGKLDIVRLVRNAKSRDWPTIPAPKCGASSLSACET